MKHCILALVFLSASWVSAEPVELHVWGMNLGAPKHGWYALIDAFEAKYPNVKIIAGPTDRKADLQKLLSGIVGNAPPDVFRRESQLFGDIASRDILMPLDDFIAADRDRPDGLHEEDYPPGVWTSGVYEGKLYGIVEITNPLVLAYNKQHFREAGLDPERPPRTWSEWIEYTRVLTLRDDSGQLTRLGSMDNRLGILLFHILQNGGQIVSEDGKTCVINNPEALEAVEFVKAMFDAMGGRMAMSQFPALNEGGGVQGDSLGLGLYSIAAEDDWVIFRTMRYHPEIELGIAPMPVPDGRDSISMSIAGTQYFIPTNARHPQEGWDFIRFANSPEGQLAYAAAMRRDAEEKGATYNYTGIWPNRRISEALSDAGYVPDKPLFRAGFETCKEIMSQVVSVPSSPASALIHDELMRVIDVVSYETYTPEEALVAAQRRVQGQLDIFYQRDSLPLLPWRYVWMALAFLLVCAIAAVRWRIRGEGPPSALARSENRAAMLFISPWVVGFVTFVAGPMLFSAVISFCDYDVLHPARFVGLRNYTDLLLEDPLFWKSMGNTVFMACTLPVGMAAGLGLALLLNTKVKGMSFYRTVFYLPAVTPMVATAVLWYALLNPNGIINAGIEATLGEWFGVSAPGWLSDPLWSKPAMVLMGLWGVGGGMILWLAGLQGIPDQLYEAAAIDGAGPVQRFWSITLPMLTPYIFFSFIVGVISVFQIFAQALVLTQGGPVDSTLFYVFYLFNNAFRYFKMGYASAQAWILFLIVMALTAIQWRLAKKWVHYE
jgi:ABC-type sugar transport system permease subunit/ABC-type glycerol-3-phosphate transport system substrate-binding protein